MKREAKRVFFSRVDDNYRQLLIAASNSPHLKRISSVTNTVDLQSISFDILNDLLPKKTFQVIADSTGRKLEHTMVSINEGRELVGKAFKTPMNSNEVKVYHLEYSFDTTGEKSCLDNTVKYNSRELPISFISNKLLMHYYFQGEPEDVAQDIQREKNQVVELINTNQKEVDDFFTSKRDSFLAHIRLAANDRLLEMKKLDDDTSLF
ncbi:hypothetical protein [Daejeonella oryzae]|uniref:hypothetical protein n=1 Tax=Daejeonella oryzae TaxID=1122943 RepID=UPI0003FD3684|nr:hypothetical protein [Daejeonella oryzae]